jgi:hypothetical protein
MPRLLAFTMRAKRMQSLLFVAALATSVACGDVAAGGTPMTTRVLVRAAKSVALGAGPTRVTLASPAKRPLPDPRPGRHLHLIVRGLRADAQPGVLYHLYLDLPAGATPSGDDPHYVGSINFYNARNPASAAKNDPFFSFDVTAIVRELRAHKLLLEPTTVTLIPGGTPEARAVVGAIELVEQ